MNESSLVFRIKSKKTCYSYFTSLNKCCKFEEHLEYNVNVKLKCSNFQLINYSLFVRWISTKFTLNRETISYILKMDFGDKNNSKGIVNNKERNFHAGSPRNSKLRRIPLKVRAISAKINYLKYTHSTLTF